MTYFFSPGMVFNVRLLIVERTTSHVRSSLGQELWLPVGEQLKVVPDIHILSWKTLHSGGK